MSKTAALHQLTRLEIVNAKAATKPYTLVDGGRLYVLVKPDGTKLGRWNYDFAGKTKTMTLGRWPEVSEKEARAAHAAGRQLSFHAGRPAFLFQTALSMRLSVRWAIPGKK